MARLFLKSGASVEAEDKAFARGGEGSLHMMLTHHGHFPLAVKLYHPEKRTRLQEEKIEYLIANPPIMQTLNGHQSIIWLRESIFIQNRFAGFSMPFAKGDKLEILCRPKLPHNTDAAWQRFSLEAPGARELRMKLCFNIAAAIYQIHAGGQYVLVDLKPENIIIQPNGFVSIVDIDSIEVIKGNTVIYRAHVATPEFTPPEYYSGLRPEGHLIPESWDRFSMAVIFYKLLLGIHPFSGNSHKPPYHQYNTLEDMIEHGLFPFGSKAEYMGVIPPPHQRFHGLPREVQNLFIQCFERGHSQPWQRPAADDWCRVLSLALGIKAPATTRIRRFEADNLLPGPGEEITLSWETENALFVKLNGKGYLAGEGSITIPIFKPEHLILNVYDTTGNILSKELQIGVEGFPGNGFHSKTEFSLSKQSIVLFRVLAVLLPLLMIMGFILPYLGISFFLAPLLVLIDLTILIFLFYKYYTKSPELTEKKRLQSQVQDVANEFTEFQRGIDIIKGRLDILNSEADKLVNELFHKRKTIQLEEDMHIKALGHHKRLEELQLRINNLNKGLIESKQNEAQEILKATERYCHNFRKDAMAGYKLNRKAVPMLTANDVEEMHKNGIEHAGRIRNIDLHRMLIQSQVGQPRKIPGIGAKKVRALYSWHTEVIQKVDAIMPSGLPQAELINIHAKFHPNRRTDEKKLAAMLEEETTLRLKEQDESSGLRRDYEHKKLALLEEYKDILQKQDYFAKASVLHENISQEAAKFRDNYRTHGKDIAAWEAYKNLGVRDLIGKIF